MQKLKFKPIDDIELLVVLGHSNKSSRLEDPMTFDAIIRCRAAGNLFKERKVKKISLVGGGNDRVLKVAEATRMRQYLLESFAVPDEQMEIQTEGINTITDLVELVKKINSEKLDTKKIVVLTSDYNVVRVKLDLEILGEKDICVFASERILLESGDYYSSRAGKYLDSEEYQKRLSYEAYWAARTVCDPKYTADARKLLNISKNPSDHFLTEPRREMKNIEE